MKILALRGRNLASLAGDFEVDFEAEPLASAGLFAISGPTGAGKSTLLDTLCLALYHQTPRLLGARSKVPDVGEELIEASNPRTLLRRGTSEGFAEVDFLGRDGVAYRARWAVRRARGKESGALQSAITSLRRRGDDIDLASQTREVAAAIEERVGLSFPQFTRAVLLAQNQFAGFLQAEDADRASLLETLTGSDIFSTLSVAAFARAKQEREALGDLQRQLTQEPPLEPAARAAVDAEREAAQAEELRLHGVVAELEAQQRWQQELAAARAAEEAAERARRDAAQQVAAAAERWARLRLTEAVQEARPLFAEAERTEREAERASREQVAAHEALATAAERLRRLEAERAPAQEALGRARARRDELAPELQAARDLDTLLAARGPEAQEAQARRRSAESELGRAREALARAEGDHQSLAAQVAAVTARLGAAFEATEPARRGAHAALEETATTLRRGLVPGEPCPVCGATDHPYAPAGGEVTELLAAVLPGLRALETQLPAVRTAAELALQQAEAARAAEERQTTALSALRRERASRLAGRAVDTVAAELAAAVAAAEGRVQALQEQGATRLGEQNRAQQAADAADASSTAALAARQVAAQALACWLAGFEPPDPLPLPLDRTTLGALLRPPPSAMAAERGALAALATTLTAATATAEERRRRAQELADQALTEQPAGAVADAVNAAREELRQTRDQLQQRVVQLAQDDARRQRATRLRQELGSREASARKWNQLSDLIGSADGRKFRNFAQQLTLEVLLAYANQHLAELARRYRLERLPGSLALLVVDQDMGDERRSVHSLSGGETFLVSLALALALASLSSQRVKVESLFIDEGFGSLDADTLGIALDALDRLQAQGRKVGVISHVAEMTERIGVRIEVQRQSGGRSRLVIAGP